MITVWAGSAKAVDFQVELCEATVELYDIRIDARVPREELEPFLRWHHRIPALILLGSDPAFGLDLTPWGVPGCAIHVGLDASAGLSTGNGTATFSLSVPGDPRLVGLQVPLQYVFLDDAELEIN